MKSKRKQNSKRQTNRKQSHPTMQLRQDKTMKDMARLINSQIATVLATATGPLSHWINGVHDNTYIFDLILSAMKGILDFNSLFLPADIDGDGILDHSSVCPYDGNWFIINNDKKAPIVIGSLEFITDIPHLGWGD